MRKVKAKKITEVVSELCIEANLFLRKDILNALKQARKNEKTRLARQVLEALIENARVARLKKLPICQDTGMAVVYADIGQEVHVTGGNLTGSITQGVREGYEKGYLRKSVVDSLGKKRNTGDNTPAIIHFNIVSGDRIHLKVAPRGFGSENCSRIRMFKPTAEPEEIKDFIVETVTIAGANPCPPVLVGVGIGGTLEKAVQLAKSAVLRRVNDLHPDRQIARLEKELHRRINRTGIGPLGFGGKTTALAVKVLDFPTHIAGLPVAVHLSCHASRLAERTI